MRASQLILRKKLQVVGIMSGTSLDGVDFVLSQIEHTPTGVHTQFLDMASVAFPKKMRESLLLAASHVLKVDALAELHFALGKFYADQLSLVTGKKSWAFDLIGLHGQTVYHRGKSASLQIGDPSFLSAVLKVPVVSDFRSADIAVNGQGAPLAPFFHEVAFGHTGKSVSIHNLGGISNLSLISDGKIISAFDTGPANMPLDLAMQILTKGKSKFDAGGKLARRGEIQSDLVAAFLRHSYFKKTPPKSCGREEFGEAWLKPLIKKYAKSPANVLASLTEAVALSISSAYKKFLPDLPSEIIFCGGGSENLFLIERLRAHLAGVEMVTSLERGWPSQAIEGGAFALLAAIRIWEIPLDLSKSTGASVPASLGKVTDLGIS